MNEHWAETFSKVLGIEAISEVSAERGEEACEQAASQDADLILVPASCGTHFAESVLRHSRVPILRLPPEMMDSGLTEWAANKIAPVLFPTDLHPAARNILERLAPLARQLKTSITIFHEVPSSAGFSFEGSAPETYRVSWDDDRKERHELAEAFVSQLRELGVSASIELQAPGRPLIESVLELARSGAFSMVAVGSKSGPIEKYFTGLVTSRLLEKAPCAVWAIHERNLANRERDEAA